MIKFTDVTSGKCLSNLSFISQGESLCIAGADEKVINELAKLICVGKKPTAGEIENTFSETVYISFDPGFFDFLNGAEILKTLANLLGKRKNRKTGKKLPLKSGTDCSREVRDGSLPGNISEFPSVFERLENLDAYQRAKVLLWVIKNSESESYFAQNPTCGLNQTQAKEIITELVSSGKNIIYSAQCFSDALPARTMLVISGGEAVFSGNGADVGMEIKAGNEFIVTVSGTMDEHPEKIFNMIPDTEVEITGKTDAGFYRLRFSGQELTREKLIAGIKKAGLTTVSCKPGPRNRLNEIIGVMEEKEAERVETQKSEEELHSEPSGLGLNDVMFASEIPDLFESDEENEEESENGNSESTLFSNRNNSGGDNVK